MSKHRKRVRNPGQRNRPQHDVNASQLNQSKARYNRSKKVRKALMKKKRIFSPGFVISNRITLNENRIQEIQNSVSAVNFTIANCKEILSGIDGNDRSLRSFSSQLRNEVIRYEDLRKRRLGHLRAAMDYDGSKRLPRKRRLSLRMNEVFKRKIKVNCRRSRKSRMATCGSLNIEDLQGEATRLMADDECQVQGLEEIELSDYDSEKNEGETYELEVPNSRSRRRRKRNTKGKGARGHNIMEMYDEDDIFLDSQSYATKYQFAIDLKFKDKVTGKKAILNSI